MADFLDSFEIIQPLNTLYSNTDIFQNDLAVSFANPELQRLCFVKSAKPSLHVKAANAALEKEAEIYKKLQHTNILHLIDVKHRDLGLWLFLEYVQGIHALSLFHLCR